MINRFSSILAGSLALTFSYGALGQVDAVPLAENDQDDNYNLVKVVEGVKIPWGMTWLSKNEMLVSDRSGELYLVRNDTIINVPIKNVPKVDARGQGGLLDLETHPNYQENGWIYISYSGFEGDEDGSNVSIARAKLDTEALALTDVELIFDGSPNTKNGRHYGSRLEFDNDGYLFFSIGDRGERDVMPQSLVHDGGKIHRIHDDGSIPKDNPFIGQDNANDSIYSYGHRNPQGMAKHPKTGKIWAHEHGPKGGDELNVINKSVNYGWPVISYGVNYSGTSFTDITSKEGMAQPKWQWTPSIAPSGMVFVDSERYPEWKGHMLAGALKFAHVVLVNMEGDEVTGHSKLFEGIGRVRSLSMSPDGYLYIGTDGNGIFKVEPKS